MKVTMLMALILSQGCVGSWLPDPFSQVREKELDELINKSENLKALAEVCAELGRIQEFKLLRRSISKDGSELYYYFSSEKPFPAASQLFSDYFSQRGWVRQDRSQVARAEFYRNEKLAIDIQYGGIGDAEYGITCSPSK